MGGKECEGRRTGKMVFLFFFFFFFSAIYTRPRTCNIVVDIRTSGAMRCGERERLC